ncbi:hypothetical protein PN499_00600 [Kamptonema animale CS-326]|uniref:hypothetical protein n=1 Tax=Kamptonema animale TaxID=92934 RepID=UPI00232C4BB5|nr:hypothetical protein [Kamptonema animale]MDB9509704.1 hypothetical protein [Kamptonema animale CS-326]
MRKLSPIEEGKKALPKVAIALCLTHPTDYRLTDAMRSRIQCALGLEEDERRGQY